MDDGLVWSYICAVMGAEDKPTQRTCWAPNWSTLATTTLLSHIQDFFTFLPTCSVFFSVTAGHFCVSVQFPKCHGYRTGLPSWTKTDKLMTSTFKLTLSVPRFFVQKIRMMDPHLSPKFTSNLVSTFKLTETTLEIWALASSTQNEIDCFVLEVATTKVIGPVADTTLVKSKLPGLSFSIQGLMKDQVNWIDSPFLYAVPLSQLAGLYIIVL